MRGAPSPAAMKYDFTGYHRWYDPDGYPAVAPPWGTLNAINLNTGEYAWKIPLGEYPELAAQGLKNTGTENYGGPIVTAGGLVFIGATNFDKKLRAFDKDTGKLLWETVMVNSGNATPITYEVNGKQYVVIAAFGGYDGARPNTIKRPRRAARLSRSPCRRSEEFRLTHRASLRTPAADLIYSVIQAGGKGEASRSQSHDGGSSDVFDSWGVSESGLSRALYPSCLDDRGQRDELVSRRGLGHFFVRRVGRWLGDDPPF